ncbi:IS3 family transposase [Propioniciclava soli]|uniref:IS3 family transposase n=1 Tax=Propioniciclava soli TaxID=2775081 RepID=UPI001E3D299C|nr:IS3 family transposase [Propioniciclava soli]
MIAYIDSHKEEFGVEPICAVLSDANAKIAPSTYYAAVARPPSKRAVADGELDERITDLFEANYGVYGVRKMWKALNRQVRLDEHGHPADEPYPGVARCTVARRMKALGLTGAVAGDHKRARTTIPGRDHRPEDSLNRDFTAQRPNQRWVADITYVPTWCGFVYVAFVLDLYARRIVGWRVASTLRTGLALDALEHGIWTRQQGGRDLSGLIHHSDRGVQGGFNWSSQHLDRGGEWWRVRGSRGRRFRWVRGGSGVRIARCGRRCARPGGRSRLERCSVISGV